MGRRGGRGESQEKENEQGSPGLSGSLERRELGNRREEQEMRHRPQQPVPKLRDLEGQKEEVREADDIQEAVGESDGTTGPRAPPEQHHPGFVEHEGGGGGAFRPEEWERRHQRRHGQDHHVRGAKSRRHLGRTAAPEGPHVTSLRRSPRRSGGNGGAASLGIASSRASASRILARCPRPVAAETFTPRA